MFAPRRIRSVPSLAALLLGMLGIAGFGVARLSTLEAHKAPPPPPAVGDTTVIDGPRAFTTASGSQAIGIEQITTPVAPATRYLLQVQNGGIGVPAATGGSVRVNGTMILSSGDLAAGSGTFTREVLLNGTDTLVVVVLGTAGSTIRTTILATADPTVTVFGPKTYVRPSGASPVVTDNFTVPDGVGAPFTMYVQNGTTAGDSRASSASVTLNSVEQLTQSNFNQQIGSMTRSVSLSANNTVAVQVESSPGNRITVRIAGQDIGAPVLTITAPAPNLITKESSIAVSGTVTDLTAVTVKVNGIAATINNGSYSATVPLAAEGSNTIHVIATDAAGNTTDSTRAVIRDTQAPALIVAAPADGFVTRYDTIFVRGSVADANPLTVSANGTPLPVDGAGQFIGSVPLVAGTNYLTIVATDAAGNTTTIVRNGISDNVAPELTLTSPADGSTTTSATTTVAGTVTDLTAVTLTVNGAPVAVAAGGAFTTDVSLDVGSNTITVVATDAAGNATTVARTVTRLQVGDPIPPDPATVAPALNRTAAVGVAGSTAFLYSGANPIQVGVAPGTIKPFQTSVLRGRVIDRSGAPLSGVRVTIKDHPELGRTASRADGAYDLVVNGGGAVTVNFTKPGYLPAQRQMGVQRQNWVGVDAVALVPLDPVATAVDFTQAASVARGSVQTDASGSRQATMVFEQGTSASMVMPDGSTQPLSTVTVRATEYTVGTNGPKAMPAALPPRSAYTYAAELSVDEALAAGASTVTFSKPVAVYIENFIGFPVGGIVPVAAYDRQKAAWIPEANGRVIRVLTTAGGVATVDVDGSGSAASAATLTGMGFTDAELVRLAGLYADGQSLWRFEVDHFSPHDANWPYPRDREEMRPHQKAPKKGDGDGKQGGGAAGGGGAGGTGGANQPPEGCDGEGSIIGCEDRTLGEILPIAGTSVGLAYMSANMPGYRPDYDYAVPLTEDIDSTLFSQVTRVMMRVSIAGRTTVDTFPATAGLVGHFHWDGKDAYGRTVVGQQRLTIEVGYTYALPYVAPPSTPNAFGQSSGVALNVTARGGNDLWQTVMDEPVGIWDNAFVGLGGWTLTAHHAYDANSGTLHLGSGRTVASANINPARSAVATGVQASDMAFLPDGSILVASQNDEKIYRYARDGTRTVFAGTGSLAASGDGGPANQAGLDPSRMVIGPDGSVFVADQFNQRFRKIDTAGVITTIAGTGSCGSTGDNGPALLATFCSFSTLAVGPDGSLYVLAVESQGTRIRRIGPDGIVTHFAGSATSRCGRGQIISVCGEDVPAYNTPVGTFSKIATGPDGSVYGTDITNNVIWRIAPNGIRTRAVGVPLVNNFSEAGDGGPALVASTGGLSEITVGGDGSIYMKSQEFRTIRRVDPAGIINTYAGQKTNCGFITPCDFSNTGNALGTDLGSFLTMIRADDNGNLYIADFNNRRVWKIAKANPGFTDNAFIVPSKSGGQVYRFDADGRHLATVDANTGNVLLTFGYDANGFLTRIEDTEGNATVIERDASGVATAITAPFGQRTLLGYGTDGLLSSVRAPGGETIGMTYKTGGLLETMTEPNQGVHRFTYDASGLLVSDVGAGGKTSTLAPTTTAGSSTTAITSAAGRTVSLQTEQTASGVRRTVTNAVGLKTITTFGQNDSVSIHTPDGTIKTLVTGSDPRFGSQAPIAKNQIVRLPNGLTRTVHSASRVVLADSLNPLSMTARVDSLVVNGRATEMSFNMLTRQVTSTSPAGRQTFSTLDTRGRVVESHAGNNVPTSYLYDARGRPLSVTQGGRSTAFGYDARGHISSVTNALGITRGIVSDSFGRVLQMVNPGSRVIGFTYNPGGDVASITPTGKASHLFTYTSDHLVETYTSPAIGGQSFITSYQYNAERRMVKQTKPDGAEIIVGYDAFGRLSTTTYSGAQTVMGYDVGTGLLTNVTRGDRAVTQTWLGRLPATTAWLGPVSGTVSQTYDSDFRVSSRSVNGTAVGRTYDPDGLLLAAGDMTYTYRSTDRLPATANLGSLRTAWSFTDRGEIAKYSTVSGADTLFRQAYLTDSLGRLSQVDERVGATTTSARFTYDSLGRLSSVHRGGTLTATYTYDDNGNRLSVVTPNGALSGTYDAQDRLTSYGDETYTYTKNGTLLTRVSPTGATTFEHDAIGHLTAAILPNGVRIDYVLDPMSRRIGVKRNGVLVKGFLYQDAINPIAEVDGSNNVVTRFVYANGNTPEYLVKDGVNYRVITDHLGSVRQVVDANTGIVAQRLEYDEFGRVILNTNPGFQPFGYAGGMLDDDTRLVHFGTREYDSYSGRWIEKDQIEFDGGSTNLYQYVSNDPINRTDRLGTCGTFDVACGLQNVANWGAQHGGFVGDLVLNAAAAASGISEALGINKLGCDLENGNYGSAAFDAALMLFPFGAEARAAGAAERVIVIGETGTRVEQIIRDLRALGADVEGFVPSTEGFANQMAENMNWLQQAVEEGAHILDVGLDAGRVGSRGPFYQAEKTLLDKLGVKPPQINWP